MRTLGEAKELKNKIDNFEGKRRELSNLNKEYEEILKENDIIFINSTIRAQVTKKDNTFYYNIFDYDKCDLSGVVKAFEKDVKSDLLSEQKMGYLPNIIID